ncbi:MAG: YIP1 family protein [Gammaproteobacteria bacterium]|nr:YIP1 family protein [Gammaproteobacteria bacterium]
MLGHITGLLFSPESAWQKIKSELDKGSCHTTVLVIILGLIPPISGYIGTTMVGWQLGAGDPIKLTNTSAGYISVLYFFAIVVGINAVALAIRWMSETYDAQVSYQHSLALSAFTAVPLLLVGIFEIYPVLWLNFLVGLLALALSVRLLYTGVPIILGVDKERGFLYSSSILAFGLIALVAMLVVTALLWGLGLEPTLVSY